MILVFIGSFWRGYAQRSRNNLCEHEKVSQIIGIVPSTEQSIKSFAFISQGFCFSFKSTFTIFKEFTNDVWRNLRRTPHDGWFC